jgi:hypothetical protein
MKCEDCRFWKRFPSLEEMRLMHGKDAKILMSDERPVCGACRFNPPTIRPAGDTRWPITTADSFCGKFESIPIPPHLKNPVQQPGV